MTDTQNTVEAPALRCRYCVGCFRPADLPHADWCAAAGPDATAALPGGFTPPGWPYAEADVGPKTDPRLVLVESETTPSRWYHLLLWSDGGAYCSCPDMEKRGKTNRNHRCKHLRWVAAAAGATGRRFSRGIDGRLVDVDTGEEVAFIPTAEPGGPLEPKTISAVLARLAEIDSRDVAAQLRADAAVANIVLERAGIKREKELVLAGFRPAARTWLEGELARRNAGRKRTVKTWRNPDGPGELAMRTDPAKVFVTDRDAALTYCEVMAPEAIVRNVDARKLDPEKVAGEAGFSVQPAKDELQVRTGIRNPKRTQAAGEPAEDDVTAAEPQEAAA